MSINLRLNAGAVQVCDLVQTSTAATRRIYKSGDSAYDTLMRYFEWLEEKGPLKAGALLDHKLEVALFLAENPGAKWSEVTPLADPVGNAACRLALRVGEGKPERKSRVAARTSRKGPHTKR